MTPRCTQAPTGAAAKAAIAAQAGVPVLETARLHLRAPRMADLAEWTRGYMAEWADPGDTEETAFEQFCTYTAGWMLHGHGLWSVARKADGVLIGFVLVGLEWDDPEPELGYLILSAHRGQGYGFEACTAARDHGMDLLGDLVSYVAPDNVASNAMAQKLGATRDVTAEAALSDPDHVWRYGGAA